MMKAVDNNHCEYYVLKQMSKYYHHLAETGQIDHKHFDMIQEELDQKIKVLKLKKNVKNGTLKEKILHSQLGMIFPEDVALATCHQNKEI